MFRGYILAFLLLSFYGCDLVKAPRNYKSDSLSIDKISDHVYKHTSFLKTNDFGNVPCNGMIVFNNGEAIIFDTPTDDSASLELISWVEENLNAKVKAVVSTHFHEDCLGGLNEFKKHHIPSYAHNSTIELASLNNKPTPETGFDKVLELEVGGKKVFADFLGEGHTKDNVIGYFPEEQILFGGCLIKEMGANKGNLEDANVVDWPFTVKKVKEKYPNIKVVVPGHGEIGSSQLLDYTIELFE